MGLSLLLSVTIEDDEGEEQKKVDALGSTEPESSGEHNGRDATELSKTGKKRVREQGDDPKGIT